MSCIIAMTYTAENLNRVCSKQSLLRSVGVLQGESRAAMDRLQPVLQQPAKGFQRISSWLELRGSMPALMHAKGTAL